MEKKEFAVPQDFIWESPVMEEFKVLSRFHGADPAPSGDPGPSYGDCTTEQSQTGEWEE